MTPEQRRQSVGGTTTLGDTKSSEASVRYWQTRTYEERLQAILEIRDLYYEVMRPGTGATRLDRSVGGTRSLRE